MFVKGVRNVILESGFNYKRLQLNEVPRYETQVQPMQMHRRHACIA